MGSQVLFISIDGMTDPLGRSQVIPYLTGLSKNGFSIIVLSAEKKNRLIDNEEKVRQLLEFHNITWVKSIYKSGIPIISQATNFFSLRRKAWKICRSGNIKLVHARSYIPALIALNLKLKLNIPFLFDMRGFWADERIEGKIWNINNPFHKLLYHFFKQKEKDFLTHSSHIISLTHNAKKELTARDPDLNQNKITVIPCCADFSLFNCEHIDQEKLSAIKKKLNLQEKNFILTYSGSLGTWYLLKEMLHFFKLLLARKPDAVFLILTTDKKETVFSEAASMNIPKASVKVVSASREEMPFYLTLSHLSIFFIQPDFSKKASSPTKLAEILGCGIPVLTNSGIGDVDALLKEGNCGYIIPQFTEENYNSIIELIDNEKFNKHTLREIALKNFDLTSGINSYISVYKKILNE